MPDRSRGLKGLRGLNEISEAERRKFMLDNADKLKKYADDPMHYSIAAQRIYNNQKFKDTFGEDAFNQFNDGTKESYDYRNALLRKKVITDAFVNEFQDDKDFASLAHELDDQGMYDLLTSDYMGTKERKKRLDAGIAASKEVGKSYDAAINNPYVDALGAGYMQIGKTSAALQPYDQDEDYATKDKNIREKLYKETQERREDEVSRDADVIYANILVDDERGNKSLAESYEEFDKLATKDSPHYAAFKNSKWLEDYTHEDRLQDYAKFQALKARYGEDVAKVYLDRSIQNRVAEAQDGSWTGNTLKGVLTTTWSDLGSNVALFAHLGATPERIGILNQGKDPDKPIYDERGNIIDYERNENWVTNPAYWNDVYKYNTFSPTEIKAIEERGGISEDVNVREYGYTPDFFSWDTMEEGFKQSGHIVAGVIETGLTGTAGKAIGWGAKGAMKGIGLSAKAMSKAAKVGNITNDLFVIGTTGLEGAQLEAMGTFEEQMQSAREKIQEQIKHELYDYQQGIDYSTPEATEAINGIFQQLKQQDKRRVATTKGEGVTALPLSDEFLMQQAMQQYTNQLLTAENQRLQELHKKDELEAARAATKAYGANFIMDYIKNVPLTTGIQKYKIAKGSMRGAFDNTINKNIVSDNVTGGVKRAKVGAREARRVGFKKFGFDLAEKEGKEINYTSAKNVAKAMGKQFFGGFADEYLDGVNASFASGIGNNDFDNYINKTYNPEAYNAVVDGMLGNMLAGMSEGIEGLRDRQNWYEGFIGMVAPFASVNVNPNMVFHPHDTWKAVIDAEDANGNHLRFAERMNNILINPLLSTYIELREKERDIDNSINAINTIVKANKKNLQDAAKLITTLDDYSAPVEEVRYKVAGNEDVETPSLLDSKDKKLSDTFTLIEALNNLEAIEGGTNSQLYQDAMHSIEGLANGTLTQEEMDEEIDKFLASDRNKSILDNPTPVARQVAAERLQKNAQYFMDVRKKVEDTEKTFNQSPNLRNIDPRVRTMLIYNIVADDDYKKRLAELEESLDLNKTDADAMFSPDFAARYGTKESRTNAIGARDRLIKGIQKEQDEIKAEDDSSKETIKALKDRLKYVSGGDEFTKIQEDIRKHEALLESRRFQWIGLEERKRILKDEKAAIEAITKQEGDTETKFSEDYILGLDARDRAEVFNPNNKDNYTKEQLSVIEHVRSKLLQKDPEAITKVQDAGLLATRIDDLKVVYNRVLQNNALAATYLDAVESLRDQSAMSEALLRGILQHYDRIEEAYANREENPNGLRDAILSASDLVVNAYMEDHPEQAEAIVPYQKLLQFERDAAAVINNSSTTNNRKKYLLRQLWDASVNAGSADKAIAYMESIIDSDGVPEEVKKDFDDILNSIGILGYQRDATIIESRKERKEREEKEAAAKQQEKEALEAAKREAEVAATEAATKKVINEKAAKEQTTGNEQTGAEATAQQQGASDEVIVFNDDGTATLEKVEPVWPTVEEAEPEETKPEEKEQEEKTEDNKEGKGSVNNNVEASHIIDNGDSVQGKSATINEQMSEANEGKEVHSSEETTDYAAQNGTGEHVIETSATSLSGNAMSEYKPAPLQNEGKLEHKQGENPTDSMSRYFAWMDAAGIKLQNIIDEELGLILKQNPHAKVKFMVVKPDRNATNDVDMKTHLMLVLDYDNKVNKGITNIHNDENGGVLESNGKKYLVIGTVGYGNRNADKLALYDILFSNNPRSTNGYGLVKRGQGEFFRTHPEERFYVPENLSTEVVPQSLIPGYIVKQLETDENPEFRSIKDLLADKERNPQGLEMQDLAWGIQERTQFLVVGTNLANVMVPRNPDANSGSAFVLIPASNSKMVPSYLKPLFYNEMRDGALKDRVEELLGNATSPNYATRLQAVIDLSNIFYMDKEGDTILLMKSKNVVSLVHDGKTFKTFVLDENFDRQTFMEAMAEMNPRVNITKSVLQSNVLLQQYDEAGALLTDIARMTTAGSSYSVYGLDAQGQMLKPEVVNNDIPRTGSNSDFRNGDRTQVVFKHQYYNYDRNEGRYYLNGIPVTDEAMVRSLDYNRRVIEGGIAPVESSGVWNTYILGSKDHPEAVKIHRNTKEVKEVSDAEALQLVEKIEKENAEKERAEAAKAALEATKVEDIDILGEEEGMVIDDETGELITPDELRQRQEARLSEKEKKEGEEEAPAQPQGQEDKLHKSGAQLESSGSQGATQNFNTLAKSRQWRKQVSLTLRQKWPETSKMSMEELKKFLKDKNVEVDTIGTSDTAVLAWIDTIINCR